METCYHHDLEAGLLLPSSMGYWGSPVCPAGVCTSAEIGWDTVPPSVNRLSAGFTSKLRKQGA